MRTKQRIEAFAYDKRGRLLAIGHNSYTKTHPLQKRYAAKTGKPDRIFLHAETVALLKASKRGKVYRLVVKRYGKKGQELLAAPCECCREAIQQFDVKVVQHT